MRMDPVTIGNTHWENKYLISWALISRHWMMADFSFVKLDISAKSWNPQVWSIVMGCQQPPRLRHLVR